MLVVHQKPREGKPACSSHLCRLAGLAALIFLAALPASGFCHPDLTAQIELLDERIQAGEVNAELLMKRGDLYRRHQDFPAAARDFEAARKLSPDNSLIDFYQGRLQLESGHPGKAEHYLALYLEAYPMHAKAWMLRGEANIQLDRPKAAAEYFGQAIQTAESPSPGLYRLLILSRLAMGESAWALRQMQQILALRVLGQKSPYWALEPILHWPVTSQRRPGDIWPSCHPPCIKCLNGMHAFEAWTVRHRPKATNRRNASSWPGKIWGTRYGYF